MIFPIPAVMDASLYTQPASVDTLMWLRYMYCVFVYNICIYVGFEGTIIDCISIRILFLLQYIVAQLNNSAIFETSPDGATPLHFATCEQKRLPCTTQLCTHIVSHICVTCILVYYLCTTEVAELTYIGILSYYSHWHDKDCSVAD